MYSTVLYTSTSIVPYQYSSTWGSRVVQAPGPGGIPGGPGVYPQVQATYGKALSTTYSRATRQLIPSPYSTVQYEYR